MYILQSAFSQHTQTCLEQATVYLNEFKGESQFSVLPLLLSVARSRESKAVQILVLIEG